MIRFGTSNLASAIANTQVKSDIQKKKDIDYSWGRSESLHVADGNTVTNLLSPSFSKGQVRPPSTSTSNLHDREEYMKSKIRVEKMD